MSEQEKQRQIICDLFNAKNKQKISEIIEVPLWPSLSPNHNPLDYVI